MAARVAKRSRSQPRTGARAARVVRNKRRDASAQLDLRRTPMQARGQATFERILDATAEVLDKVGTEALTTNLIARTAKVNVATLYQYFPNKQAVLLTLFKRHSAARLEIGTRTLGGMSRSGDWRSRVALGVDAAAAARRQMGGAAALRLAMRSSPDLIEHDRAQLDRLAATLAAEVRGAGVKDGKASLVARCAVEALSSLLDLGNGAADGEDSQLVEQATDMVTAYLAPYLDKAKVAGRAKPRRR
jgi:AcrR family transcriptional regulator